MKQRYLYDIFVNSSFVLHPCPMLIAVNKSDLPGCKENDAVFSEIEDELFVPFFLVIPRDKIKELRLSANRM